MSHSKVAIIGTGMIGSGRIRLPLRISSHTAVCVLIVCAALAALPGIALAQERALNFFDALPEISNLATANEHCVAWVSTVSGKHTLWVADTDDLIARPRLSFSDDDGIPVYDLSLSADCDWLIYTRGSFPNGGLTNNPLDLPKGTERSLYALKLQGGSPIKVAGGPGARLLSPSIDPSGRRIAYAEGGKLWLAELSERPVPRLVTEVRGSIASFVWSPPGTDLAISVERSATSFVGTVEVGSGKLRWLAPSIDQDVMPRWSPDGRQVAFIRHREEVQSYRFTPRLTGIPWSIMVANPVTGVVRTAWTAASGPGSALYRDNAALEWVGKDQLVFTWERTGWSQLYQLSIAAGATRPLTGFEGEISGLAVTPGAGAVYFKANAELRERLDLWRLDLKTSKARKIADGVSKWDALQPLADGGVAYVADFVTAPQSVAITSQTGSTRMLRTPGGDESFEFSSLPAPSVLRIRAEDGLESDALLYIPSDLQTTSRHAALLYVHGGSRDVMTLGISDYESSFVQAAVADGYIVMALNYRGGIGYGLEFREAVGYGGSGGSETRDAVAAGRWLAEHPMVDAKRIGIYGISYGGYMATASAARAPDVFAAITSIVGVGDWQTELELDRGGTPLPFRLSVRQRLEDLAHESSANAMLDNWRAPLLLLSADDDVQGWTAQAVQLGQSLRRRGIAVEAYVEPSGTHKGATHAQRRLRVQRMLDFFDRHLRSP